MTNEQITKENIFTNKKLTYKDILDAHARSHNVRIKKCEIDMSDAGVAVYSLDKNGDADKVLGLKWDSFDMDGSVIMGNGNIYCEII